MDTAGDLDARLRAADDAWTTVLGTSRQWRRPDLVTKAFDDHFADPARTPSWTITMDSEPGETSGAENDTVEIETVEAVLSVAFDARGRRRPVQKIFRRGEEWLPDLLVYDGPTFWARTGAVVQTNDGDERRGHGGSDIIELLTPSRVPDGYHLSLSDEVDRVAGRTCAVATARPREPDPTGRRPGSEVFNMIAGGTVFRLSIDQQTGVLLRVVKLVDDTEAEVCEFLDITFDAPLEDALFAPPT